MIKLQSLDSHQGSTRKRLSYSWLKYAGLGAVILVSATGCADRNKDNVPDSAATTKEVKNSVDKASTAIEKGVEKGVAKGAVAIKNVANATKDSAVSTKVKGVLIADKKVDASKINVDTKGKIIYLRGTARTAQQRSLIVAITTKTMPGYSISNLLKVPGEKFGYVKQVAGKVGDNKPQPRGIRVGNG